MKKPTDFEDYLKEQLKNKEFKKHYEAYGRQIPIAYSITQLRRKSKLSQAQLAKKIGTTQSNVARMESGDQNFTIDTLGKIAETFGKELRVEFA